MGVNITHSHRLNRSSVGRSSIVLAKQRLRVRFPPGSSNFSCLVWSYIQSYVSQKNYKCILLYFQGGYPLTVFHNIIRLSSNLALWVGGGGVGGGVLKYPKNHSPPPLNFCHCIFRHFGMVIQKYGVLSYSLPNNRCF